MPIEDTQHTEFYELVEASPEFKARYDQATGEAQLAASELGADISQEEATELYSVRVATLTDGYIDPDIMGRELSNLGPVKAAKRQAALRQEMENGDSNEALAEINRLPPPERINWARKHLPKDTSATGPEKLTAEEEARMVKSLEGLPAHYRMTVARRFGLGV